MIVVGPAPADRLEIVGVSADAKYTQVRAATPATIYFPALQRVDGNANFAVRVSGVDGAAMTSAFAAVRSAVREIDPALPVLNLRTQDEQIDRLHAPGVAVCQALSHFWCAGRAACRHRPLRSDVARRSAENRRDRTADGAGGPADSGSHHDRAGVAASGGPGDRGRSGDSVLRGAAREHDDVWNVAGRSRDLRRQFAACCWSSRCWRRSFLPGARAASTRLSRSRPCRDGIEERVLRTLSFNARVLSIISGGRRRRRGSGRRRPRDSFPNATMSRC